MSGLRTVWLVARWEFTSTLRRPSFVASLIGLPLTHFLLAALIGFSVQTVSKEDSAQQPIAVVDAAAVLSGTQAGRDLIVRDVDAALRALHTGQLAGVYVLHVDYLHSGRVDESSRGPSSILQLGRQIEHRERVAALIRRGLLQDDSPRGNRLVEPIASVNTYRVGDESISRESSTPILGLLAGPVGVCFVLGLAIFLAAGLLQQAMESEMQNRMLEVVLSIITPAALLTGKVAGLSAAGLLQLGVELQSRSLPVRCWGAPRGYRAPPGLVGRGVCRRLHVVCRAAGRFRRAGQRSAGEHAGGQSVASARSDAVLPHYAHRCPPGIHGGARPDLVPA